MDGAGLAQGSPGTMEVIGPTGIDAAGIDATGAIDGSTAGDIAGTSEPTGAPLAVGSLGHATGDIPGATIDGAALGIPDASCAMTTAGPLSNATANAAVPIQDLRAISRLSRSSASLMEVPRSPATVSRRPVAHVLRLYACGCPSRLQDDREDMPVATCLGVKEHGAPSDLDPGAGDADPGSPSRS